MKEELVLLKEKVHSVSYAFYRYEITSGLSRLDEVVSQLSKILTTNQFDETKLQEINQLLNMILVAVEKKDFLIAADLLKYEVLERIMKEHSLS